MFARISFALVICLAAGCASPSAVRTSSHEMKDRNLASEAPDFVGYYYGEVSYFSEDGKIPYGGTHSVIKRTTSPKRSRIIEEMVQAPRSVNLPAFQSVTTITRVDDTNVLVATDGTASFVGKMIFDGPIWQWDGWTYSISLLTGPMAGGTLSGHASLTSRGMRIEKVSRTPLGNTVIRERHWPITSAQYEACKSKLLASSSPAVECAELKGAN